VVYPVAPTSTLKSCKNDEVFCYNKNACVLPDPHAADFCVPEAIDLVGVGSFRWGASTAAYQVEGGAYEDGKGLSNWDVFAAVPGRVANGDTGDVAADSYHRWHEDVELLADLGVKHYRFSVSWSRVLPKGEGEVNAKGLKYYNNLVDALIKRGITPTVCLFHWDLPQALEEQGGWLNKEMITRAFTNYARVMYEALGDRVKTWITLNEPGTVVYMGYNMGLMAPGRCADRRRCAKGDSFREPLVAGHNMLVAHAHAVDAFRREFKPRFGGTIGMVNCVKWAEPQDRADASQWKLAQFLMEAEIGFFTDPLYFGDYPLSLRDTVGGAEGPLPQFTPTEKRLLAGSQDFFGLNFYTSHYVWDPPQGGGIGPQGGSSWLFVTPGGLRNQLHWITARYGAPPIYITENGCDQPDEDRAADPSKPDHFRIAYMHEYIEQAAVAALEGVNLQGYYVWSLLDNFEWADGYSKRFGIVHVDFDGNQDRTPKTSYYWLKRLLSTLGKASPNHGKYKEGSAAAALPAALAPLPAAAGPVPMAADVNVPSPWARLAATGGMMLALASVALGLLVWRRRRRGSERLPFAFPWRKRGYDEIM